MMDSLFLVEESCVRRSRWGRSDDRHRWVEICIRSRHPYLYICYGSLTKEAVAVRDIKKKRKKLQKKVYSFFFCSFWNSGMVLVNCTTKEGNPKGKRSHSMNFGTSSPVC